jgi:hypothetical protein
MKKIMPIIMLSVIPFCSTYAQNVAAIHAEKHNNIRVMKIIE